MTIELIDINGVVFYIPAKDIISTTIEGVYYLLDVKRFGQIKVQEEKNENELTEYFLLFATHTNE